MEAYARGGAAMACTAFESYYGSKTLSVAALAAVASSPHCAALHATKKHRGDAQWPIR